MTNLPMWPEGNPEIYCPACKIAWIQRTSNAYGWDPEVVRCSRCSWVGHLLFDPEDPKEIAKIRQRRLSK